MDIWFFYYFLMGTIWDSMGEVSKHFILPLFYYREGQALFFPNLSKEMNNKELMIIISKQRDSFELIKKQFSINIRKLNRKIQILLCYSIFPDNIANIIEKILLVKTENTSHFHQKVKFNMVVPNGMILSKEFCRTFIYNWEREAGLPWW